jgi:6-phosphogluconate dehydrogenase (decarboxylating)
MQYNRPRRAEGRQPNAVKFSQRPRVLEIRRTSLRLGRGARDHQDRIDEGVPVPVLTTELYERFSSRGDADFQDKLLSAMRFEFGGHLEKSAK